MSTSPIQSYELGIHKYLQKRKIRSPKDYVEPLQEAVKSVRLKLYGKFGELDSYLADPVDVEEWMSRMLIDLGCQSRDRKEPKSFGDEDRKGGVLQPISNKYFGIKEIQRFEELIYEALDEFCPILKRHDVGETFLSGGSSGSGVLT